MGMKHTPLTALAILALALVGCSTEESEPVETAADRPVTETPAPSTTPRPTEEEPDDEYLDYLTDDQRATGTDEQLASYNDCMAMLDKDFQAAGLEFDGLDAHYNCIQAIEGIKEEPDLSQIDWDYMREVSECYDQLVIEKPWILDDLPQEEIVEDLTIVFEHPEVQEHCL